MPQVYQICRPSCLVIGIDRHTGLGTIPVPPFIAPNPNTYWASLSTTVWTPAGDVMSDNVYGHTEGFVKRGSDTKYGRLHFSLFAVPPVPAVPPVSDLGLILLHIALGSTKTVWGPFSVRFALAADDKNKNPAIIFPIPYAPLGLANQKDCSDPISFPSIVSIQYPNSVLAGMTLGDHLGSLLATTIDEIVGVLTGLPFSALNRRIGVAGRRALSPVTNRLLRTVLRHLWADGSEALVEHAAGELADNPAEFVSTACGDTLANWVDQQYP